MIDHISNDLTRTREIYTVVPLWCGAVSFSVCDRHHHLICDLSSLGFRGSSISRVSFRALPLFLLLLFTPIGAKAGFPYGSASRHGRWQPCEGIGGKIRESGEGTHGTIYHVRIKYLSLQHHFIYDWLDLINYHVFIFLYLIEQIIAYSENINIFPGSWDGKHGWIYHHIFTAFLAREDREGWSFAVVLFRVRIVFRD